MRGVIRGRSFGGARVSRRHCSAHESGLLRGQDVEFALGVLP